MLEAATQLQGVRQAGADRLGAPRRTSSTSSTRERLARDFPNARLERIDDSYTFVSEDQPERLAKLIAEFAREPVAARSDAS